MRIDVLIRMAGTFSAPAHKLRNESVGSGGFTLLLAQLQVGNFVSALCNRRGRKNNP